MDELSSDSQQKPGPVVFLRYRSVCLPTQKSGAHDASLFVEAAGRGKSEVFVSLYREVPTTGGLLDAFRLLVLG